MQKVNKGEWSEFYTFIYVLAKGKIHSADENLNKIEDQYYIVLSALKHDLEYWRNTDYNTITFEEGNNSFSISIDRFKDILEDFFESIKSGSKTFEIPEIEPLIHDLHISKVKESSNIKGDIRLRIHDELTNLAPIHSFSIKSYVGGAPTLLNTSNATIFTYEIDPKLPEEKVTEINNLKGGRGWLDQIILSIKEAQSKLKFLHISSETFKQNLEMIDFLMPEILADILVQAYLVNNKNLNLSVESYLDNNQQHSDYIIKYKIQELLVASALGMVPNTQWNGLDHANGGYIVVKETGEVLCYHLFERNKLREYLYNNTRFETPSTSRYGIGQIFIDEEGRQLFQLGLQIRF